MNYFHHPNLLVQYWASLNTEFDKLLDSFVKRDGWLFQDLGVCAKRDNIGSIYRCVATMVHNPAQGRLERRDHFHRVLFVILDAAKNQWLAPWRKYVVDPSKGFIPPFFKRQVGGFFLLYMFYSTLPSAGRHVTKLRISMDKMDLLAMHVFFATLQRLPKSNAQFKELTKQIVVLYNHLVNSEAFDFLAYNDYFHTVNSSTRKLLAAKFCHFTQHIYNLKDIRDQLHYITYRESPKVFQSLIAFGRQLKKVQLMKSGEEKPDKKLNLGGEKIKTDFHPANEPWTIAQILELEKEPDIGKIAHSIPAILKSLDFGPILSRKRLTGVSDKILDKELDNCARVHETHQRLLDINKRRNQAEKERQTDDCSRTEKEKVWKSYITGDFNWLNNVLSQQDTKVPDTKEESSESQVGQDDSKSEAESMDVDSQDSEEGEWETEDEEENRDVVLPQFENKLRLNVSEDVKKKSGSQWSDNTLFSMPTIDFPDLSSANVRFEAAIKSENPPKKKQPAFTLSSPLRLSEAKEEVKTRSGRVVKKKKVEN